MASSLQNAFTRTLGGLSTTSSFKKILSHGSLYLGILIYTALGAKVGKKKKKKSLAVWPAPKTVKLIL